jgi:hypothetical protein
VSARPLTKKNGQANQENKLLDPGSKIGCFWVSHLATTPKSVGWVECNETQQSMMPAQPNLRMAALTRIAPNTTFEV